MNDNAMRMEYLMEQLVYEIGKMTFISKELASLLEEEIDKLENILATTNDQLVIEDIKSQIQHMTIFLNTCKQFVVMESLTLEQTK